MADEAKWIKPGSGEDLIKALSAVVWKACNANTSPDSIAVPPASINLDDQTRADDKVDLLTKQVRGYIEKAGRYPVSVLAGSVPPEVLNHLLNLAAWELICSTPNLQAFIMTEKGPYAPLKQLADRAVKYIDKLGEGAPVSLPSEPTGIDYLTAISDENPKIRALRWGDQEAKDSDYEQGYVERNGANRTLPTDDMRAN